MITSDSYFDRSIPEMLMSGYSRVTESELNRIELSEFAFRNTGTGYFGALYKYNNGLDVEYIYANRGTDELMDWYHNIRQGNGLESEQYSQAIVIAQALNDRLGNARLTFVGHSLGGGLAAAQAYATGREAIVFNPAGVHQATIPDNAAAGFDDAERLITVIHNAGDILTSAQDFAAYHRGEITFAGGEAAARIGFWQEVFEQGNAASWNGVFGRAGDTRQQAREFLEALPTVRGNRVTLGSYGAGRGTSTDFFANEWNPGGLTAPFTALTLHGMSHLLTGLSIRAAPSRSFLLTPGASDQIRPAFTPDIIREMALRRAMGYQEQTMGPDPNNR